MIKCKCTFAIRMLGEGCRYCQPQEYIDRMHEQMADYAVSAYNQALEDVAAAIKIGADELDKLRSEHDKALNLLKSWQTCLGARRGSCDDEGRVTWDKIDALLASQSPPTP